MGIEHELGERVRAAAGESQGLELQGHGSKRFLGEEPRGTPWLLGHEAGLNGIWAWDEGAQEIRVGAATPLRSLEHILGAQGWSLTGEPPCLGGEGTVGGMVATGLSGPAAAYHGAVIEGVRELRVLDAQGRAQVLAGAEARCVVGAMGTLGLITEARLRVLPLPAAQCTLRFEVARQEDALYAMQQAMSQGFPLSASVWCNGQCVLRLSGAEEAVRQAATRLGGDVFPEALAQAFWAGLRHQTDAFFVAAAQAVQAASGVAVWRMELPASAPAWVGPGEQLIEGGGALRWLVTSLKAGAVRERVAALGGQATLYAALRKEAPVFPQTEGPLAARRRTLRARLDPHGLFNPGRLAGDGDGKRR